MMSERQGSSRGESLRVRIPPRARSSATAREEVRAFARHAGIAAHDVDEFIFAVGEALANAIEHSGTSDVIDVHCRVEGENIVATIVDSGTGFATEQIGREPLADPLAERGRGLTIMQRCSDIFSLRSIPGGGTAVVVGRRMRSNAQR